MAGCAGYWSSLAYWATRPEGASKPEYVPSSIAKTFDATSRTAAHLRTTLAEAGALPEESAILRVGEDGRVRNTLNLIVPTREQRRTLVGAKVYALRSAVQGKNAIQGRGLVQGSDSQILLPENSICQIGEEAYVMSPDATFLEIASRAPLAYKAVEAGYLLCASFALSCKGYERTGRHEPPTDVAHIAHYLEQMRGIHGVARARRVLQWVHDGCDSPPEVNGSMLFGLPYGEGGIKFPFHEVAWRFDLKDEVYLRALGCGYVKADLYVPSLDTIFEYDSYEDHMGKWLFDHTQQRAGILRAMGHRVVSVTNGQIKDFQSFMDSVYVWENELGLPHRVGSEHERNLQREVHDFLFRENRRRF